MVKRLKFDESGDSDDLQALFDSIASAPAAAAAAAQPHLEVVPAPVAPAPAPEPALDKAGDDDDLQALFDSVASEFSAEHEDSVAAGGDATDNGHLVFNRIGVMTRQLHDTLRELGYDRSLQEAAHAIPDARQRLSYIAEMTARGDFPRIALGIAVMALFVVGCNRLFWNRLYDLAQSRTRL